MGINVVISYTPANDIFNAPAQEMGVISAAPIRPLRGIGAASDAYIYAPAGATAPVYNREALSVDSDIEAVVAVAGIYSFTTYGTASQRRWPTTVTDNIKSIIEAYKTPQVPVYRAWQSFKLAIDGSTPYTFQAASAAEADFYVNAGKALVNYGITVTSTTV